MNKSEITLLASTIQQRGLMRQLKRKLRIIRPTISADTIARAWRADDYADSPEAIKLVLTVAKELKILDDARIEREMVETTKPELAAT